MLHFHLDLFYILSAFNENLDEIKSYPDFFQSAIDWGLSTSFKALAWMSAMALLLKLFKD